MNRMARSQFTNAWAAITSGNVSNFNRKYGSKTRRHNRKNRKTRRVKRRNY